LDSLNDIWTQSEQPLRNYCHGAWRQGATRKVIASEKNGTGVRGNPPGNIGRDSGISGAMVPGDSGLTARRWLLCLSILRRLAPGGTCPPPGGLEADKRQAVRVPR